MIESILAVVCGSAVGFALALTGGGGSTLAIPLLLYVVGLQDMHLAIGTSAVAVALNAYVNLIPHARAGHVHWRAAIILAVCGVAGAFAGSELGKLMDGAHLAALFAVLMIVVALLMLRPRKAAVHASAGDRVRYLNTRLGGTGLGVGAVAGFFGVGGGFLIVPGLMLAARLDIIDAIGTSLFGVGTFALTTALNYARSGLVDWPVAGEFIAGGIAGGWAGAVLAKRLAHKHGVLNIVFAVMLIAIAVYMLIRR
ncbi:MAG TPA: sulfite exporter TauE/SafE family protein [Rhodanobacteraceae bacterium]